MPVSKTFEYIKSPSDSSLVLICDHASNHLPNKMNSLGLSKDHLKEEEPENSDINNLP